MNEALSLSRAARALGIQPPVAQQQRRGTTLQNVLRYSPAAAFNKTATVWKQPSGLEDIITVGRRTDGRTYGRTGERLVRRDRARYDGQTETDPLSCLMIALWVHVAFEPTRGTVFGVSCWRWTLLPSVAVGTRTGSAQEFRRDTEEKCRPPAPRVVKIECDV